MKPGDIKHATAIDRRHGIQFIRTERRIERADDGLQVAALDQVIALAVREIGNGALDRSGIGKRTGLVRAFIHGRATNFSEPDRLAARRPCRRAAELGTSDAFDVRVGPPVPQILWPIDPRLAKTVGDRRACLRGARSIVGVIPVIGFASVQVRCEIGAVMDRRRERRIELSCIVAPVRQRRIVIDADGVDGR